MSVNRRDEEAIAWAGQLMGGRVVRRECQNRWRPQWILDVDLNGKVKRVILRGFRNPGYTEMDEGGVRAFLEKEAEVLMAVQGMPVKFPKCYGHNRELGWMLMEFVEGDSLLTAVEDSDRRFMLFNKYIEELAQLHAYPVDLIRLPKSMERPRTARDFKQNLVRRHLEFYRNLDRKRAEPSLELGLQWVIHNELPDERPLALGFGDVGPNQFLFEGNEVKALIDFEYAIICDPLMEMGMMRSRDVTYHTGHMPEHLRHYGKCYQDLTGIPLSFKSLQYWTIAGPALWNVFTVAGTQNLRPSLTDSAFVLSWEVQQKRCILEGLAEQHDITLVRPELPESRATTLGPIHELLVAQLEQHYLPSARDLNEANFIKYSAAMAKVLSRGNGCHLKLERENLDELGVLLGSRIDDLGKGLWLLENDIRSDHMKKFERRLNFLYRYEVRRDYLYEPMQIASGVSVAHAMTRMSEHEGRVRGKGAAKKGGT